MLLVSSCLQKSAKRELVTSQQADTRALQFLPDISTTLDRFQLIAADAGDELTEPDNNEGMHF